MMMDRIREARRGSMAGVNAGLSRRRQRNSLRDSLEEDGPMEVPEMGRLRDRGSKKDKDRDRSNRSKRRRGDRMMHGSHREEGEESSEESVDEEEDDEDDDASMSVRPPHTAPSASVIQNYHLRRGLPAKPMRPPGSCTWKVAEEMIGAPIPRKARSSSVKRSQECWVSGSGVDGGVEQGYRNASTSPARPSPSSTAPASPSSSNASVRKKMKTISGTKHRPTKTSKSSSIQEIEIEVAEVLFGMTRQVPPKLENHKHDSKESNGIGNEVKSRVSSPVPTSSSPATSQPSAAPSNLSSSSTLLTTNAPKRKKPRMRLDEESLTSPPVSPVLPEASALKLEAEARAAAGLKAIAASPRSDDNTASALVDNGGVSLDPAHSNISSTLASPIKVQHDSVKEESSSAPDSKDTESRPEKKTKEDTDSSPKESPSHVNIEEPHASKAIAVSESPREEKFSIDLMAPTGKSSAEMENTPVDIRMAPKLEASKGEGEEMDKKSMSEPKEIVLDDINVGNLSTLDCDSKNRACKERNLDVQPYEEKHQKLRQESRTPKVETIYDKAGPAASLPMSMQIAGWPGGFPAFGYVGQVPPLTPVVPVDGSSTSSKTLQSFLPPQLRLKRCSTHCYVAQNILYHQQITRLNSFWPSAAGATPLYAPKQYNLNTVPSSDTAIHGSPLQGSSLPGRSLGSIQEKGSPATAAHSAPSTKDKSPAANPLIDGSQRKSQLLQQPSQPGSAGNMLAPAFIYPLNQQHAAAAGVATTNRSVVAKLAPVTGNAAQMSSNTSYATLGASGTGGPGTSMSFNYPGLPPNEAQYLAFLQNNAYSFPIPTHVGGAPPYRGANAAQTMPFFNVSFYPPQMLHPSQIHLPQQPPLSQQSIYSQQGHQNPSTSSGSSSSQKNTQQSQKVPPAGASAIAAGNSRGFPPSKQPHLLHQTRHTVSETGGEDAPCTADSRVLQDQKSIFTQKFSMPAHSQNFTLIAPSTAPLSSGGGNHSEKLPHHQTPNQVMKMDLIPSQAFAMSFASFGGAAAAAGGAAPNGLEFSSITQNHALLQSLPEAARHGYQISSAAVAAAAHHTAQQHPNKKSDDRRSAADLGNSTTVGEEGKVPSISKALGNAPQQSLTFSKADKEASISSIIGNNLIDSSRTLNLIQPPSVGGARLSSRPVSSLQTPFSGTPVSQASNSLHLQSQQYQQQVLQLQKQEQQRAKPSSSHNNATVYSDRLLSNSNASKFPQALGGFHPTFVQGSAPTQSPQWKASPRAATPASSPAPSQTTSSSVKNQISLQQQVRSPQPTVHQTQISFGVNPKAAGQVAHHVNEGGGTAASLSPSATAAAGSSLNSVSKNLGVSPHSSSSTPKSGPAPPSLAVLPFQRPQMGKSPPSSSSTTTSSLPAANRNMPSILGNPHTNPAANAKPQPPSQYLPPHQLPKQQLPQPQFFFSNSYLQAQASQSDVVTAAAAYFQQHQQRRPTDQQQSQQQQNSGTNSTLSLVGSSSATLDQSKGARAVVPAGNSKGSPSAGHTRHPAQLATVPQLGPGAAHPLMTAAAAAFPYIHTMQSVPVKPPAAATGAEQKPAADEEVQWVEMTICLLAGGTRQPTAEPM